MRTTFPVRAAAPVARSTFWLMISLIAWELFQGIRAGRTLRGDSWAIAPFDLAFLVLLPALAAFAFTSLSLVINQSQRGSLNVYSVISSPFAWVFWVGLSIALIGHGIHVAAHALHRALPETFIQGEFATKVAFLDARVGYLLLGGGFFLVTAVILILGQGSGQRVAGFERLFFFLASLATYGVIFIYMAVEGGLLIPVIGASVVLSIIGFWLLPPYEMSRDPVAASIMPGVILSGIALIVWAVVVGGQPTWP